MVLKKNKKNTVNKKFKHTYFGPEVEKINSKLIKYLKSKNLNYQKIKNVEKFSANLLSKGKVIGWVQGKMEFGPRALGNRSILACTNNIKIKDHLNSPWNANQSTIYEKKLSTNKSPQIQR